MFIVIDISDPLLPMIACDPDSQEPYVFELRKEAEEEASLYEAAVVMEYENKVASN